MAETRTPRMGQPQYSDALVDEWSLADFNEAWAAVEARAARYVGQGATGARPAAAAQYVGGFYWNTTTLRLEYCTATPAWVALPSDASIDALLDALEAAGPLAAWPIGSIYMGATNADPATLLGGGTWARFGQGRVLVSQTDADTDFDVALETGGSKTLTAAMLPPHTHTGPSHTHPFTTDAAGNHQHTFDKTDPSGNTIQTTGGGGVVGDDTYTSANTSSAGSHSHTGTTDAGGTGATGNGPGTSATHMPPYIVVYMWRRTA